MTSIGHGARAMISAPKRVEIESGELRVVQLGNDWVGTVDTSHVLLRPFPRFQRIEGPPERIDQSFAAWVTQPRLPITMPKQ